MHLMDRVRRVRNVVLHFRGNLSYSEQDALRKAFTWIGQQPMVSAAPPFPPAEPATDGRATAANPYFQVMGRKPRTLPVGDEDK